VFDIDKWKSKSPIARWTAFIALLVSFTYGIFSGVLHFVDRFSAPPPSIVEIRSGNFEKPGYFEIFADIVNPASSSRSFRELGIICRTYSNKEFYYTALNNIPPEFNPPEGLRTTPINVIAGEAENVRLAFARVPSFEINKLCKSIAITWIDEKRSLMNGGFVEIPKNVAAFSSIEHKVR